MDYLILDAFAGGGGASTGIEMALNRSPDVAWNHNGAALAIHEANHPHTMHFKVDIWEEDPMMVTRGRKVGLAWFSPDCTNFSKAKGGKPMRPKDKKSRGLAWVIVNWAKKVRPRVIMLENVEEFKDWGPVVHQVGTDGHPKFDTQGLPWYVPCPKRKGQTFQKWKRRMERLGYVMEMKELRGRDYGSPTIRKRLFIILRCDGEPIVWPEPTHGRPGSAEVLAGRQLPWRTAAGFIDWSLPCPSIFLTKQEAKLLKKTTGIQVNRPLEENTMKRIFQGLKRYVLECAKPFVVYCNHKGSEFRGYGVDSPANTVTCSRDGLGVVNPYIVRPAHGEDGRWGHGHHSGAEPLPTVTGSNEFSVAMPYVSFGQHGGANRSAADPLHTITASNKDQNLVVTPYCVPRYGEAPGQDPRCSSVDQPLATVVPTGNGAQLVAPILRKVGIHSCGNCGAEFDAIGDVSPSPRQALDGYRLLNNPCPQCGYSGCGFFTEDPSIAPFIDSQYGNSAGVSVESPCPTVMSGGGGKTAVVAPVLTAYHGERADGSVARSVEMTEPLRTQDTSNRYALVEAFIAQHNTGVVGHHPAKPLSTITSTGTQQNVVAAYMAQHNTGSTGRGVAEPLSTIVHRGTQQQLTAVSLFTNTSGHGPTDPNSPMPTLTTGQQQGVAAAYLSEQRGSNKHGAGGDPAEPCKTVTGEGTHHAAVMAFLMKYYGEGGQWSDCNEPIHTVPTKERMGIVTVDEIDYVIVDIGMRMLTARELFCAQGFPDDYKIDVWCDDRGTNKKGKRLKPGMLTKEAQVRCAGNSVCPQVAAALVAANCPWLKVPEGTVPPERTRDLREYYVRKPTAKAKKRKVSA